MAPIDRIIVAGFKSIKALDLRLRPLNILIGANGAGKSNFIGVLDFLNHIIYEDLQTSVARLGGADRLLHYGTKNTKSIDIHLALEYLDYGCELIPAKNDSLIFRNEKIHSYKVPTPVPIAGRYLMDMDEAWGHKESKLLRWAENKLYSQVVGQFVGQWRVYHFHDTSESAPVKKTCNVDDNRYLRSDASNLSAYLYWMKVKEPQYYQNIVDVIKLAAPFFGDFELEPSKLNTDFIKLEWREKNSAQYFDSSSFSDGTLRFICLATLLMQPDHSLPSTIIIDEPELGLHPYALNLLAGMMRSASMKTQLIVSTQSVTLVNQFTPEDVIVVDREEGQSTFRRLAEEDMSEWLEDYGLGDLWEKNIFGGRP